jgi:AdoMet-dependent heme synthase
MIERPTVVWELTRACELDCVHCPNGDDHVRSVNELTTFDAYKLVDQVVKLEPRRFIISGGDPLTRDDVFQLVDYARRRGLLSSIALAPTTRVNAEAIARLRRNGLSRIIVSLDDVVASRHDELRGVPGSYRRTRIAIDMAQAAGIDVEVSTLVRSGRIELLPDLFELVEGVGAVAWNLYLPVTLRSDSGSELSLTDAEVALVESLAVALRARSGMEVRIVTPPSASRDEVVFITAEGFVRRSEFFPINAGDLRRESLPAIYRRSEYLRAQG